MSRYIVKNYESKNAKMSYNGTEEGEACNNILYERYIKLAWLNISTPFLH